MIQRNKTALVQKLLQYFPAVGIIGARQVGKTTLVKMLIEQMDAIYLDLEHPRDLAKIADPVLFFEDNLNTCIILDEIQEVPSLFRVLRAVIDENRSSGRFIILGSASPELMRDSSESLAGRIAYIELPTLNLLETGKKNKDKLWIDGGYPEIFNSTVHGFKNHWYLNYMKTYIERDLPQLGLNIDKQLFIRLFQMLSHVNGDVLNANNLSKSLGVSSVTIKKYINYLEHAFLIRQLPPYHFNIKKRLVKSPKLFFRDSGFLHFLQNITSKSDLYGHPKLGSSWEGFVIEQIIQHLPANYDCFFYRTHEGAEIDLLITRANKPYMSIEIKYTASPKLTRGNTIALNDLGCDQNFIITPNGDTYSLKKNIITCSLFNFLKEHVSSLKN